MRFNWFHALCVLAIAIVILELHPFDRNARAGSANATAGAPWKSALVADSGKRSRDLLRDR
jgi:hypothetical protein